MLDPIPLPPEWVTHGFFFGIEIDVNETLTETNEFNNRKEGTCFR
jgi:hypothetical protein